MKIEALNKKHDRNTFDCGTECLNVYLRQTANQHGKRGGSKTFVMIDEKRPTKIVAYFTMTVCEVDLENIPEKIAKGFSKGPFMFAILLARLAVDKIYQGNGYGSDMIIEAMKRTLFITDIVGGWGLFVEAKDKKAVSFYEHMGFCKLSEQSNTLFISIKTIQDLKLF